MTQTLEMLSRRTKTLRSIRGVVRTMKSLAAVNAVPYERAVDSIDAFHKTILQGLQIFAMTAQMDGWLESSPPAPRIALIFGSDHGLCGGYNNIVAKAAFDSTEKDDWIILAIGAQMEDALSELGITQSRRFTPPASAEGIGRLAGEILIELDRYQQMGKAGEITVTLFHMNRGRQGQQVPVTTNLLPLEKGFLGNLAKRPWNSNSLPVVTMDTGAIFAALIRNHLFASLFRTAAEAMASENGARLALMQQAERAIDDRYEDVLRTTRSVRQSEITSELLDVITGFELLRKKNLQHRVPTE